MKNRHLVLAAGSVTAAALVAVESFATWTSAAKVTRVRSYGGSDRIDIWFSTNITTGCTDNDKISVDSSYVTSTERREQIREVAIAGRLSGRDVEVNTLAGCSNGYGKVDYISLK